MKYKHTKNVFKMFFLAFFMGIAVLCWGYIKPTPFDASIYYHGAAYDVDPALIKAMIRVESKFNPNAVSRKGARGLMQLMPPTAAEIAEQLNIANYNEYMLFEPDLNIMFGTRYISMLLNMFNFKMALAAYNAGMGNVERWKYKNPIVEFETNLIPFRETKNYVKKVQRHYKLYRGAERLKQLITF